MNNYKKRHSFWDPGIAKGTIIEQPVKIICKNCGTSMQLPRNRDGKYYCPNCGKEIKKAG